MTHLQRKLGTVIFGNYFEKILWLDLNNSSEYKFCRLSFNVDNLLDKFDSDKDLPEFTIGNVVRTFCNCRLGGGMRYKSYYKIYLDLSNIEELISVTKDIIQNPDRGLIKFKITKDLETLINEFKISLL